MPKTDAFSEGFPEEEVDFSGFTSEEEVTAPEYPAEGIYHFLLADVDSSGRSFPGAVFLQFEILAGNVERQAGKIIRHVVWPVSDQAKNPEAAKKQWMKNILQLMLAFGLRKAGEWPEKLKVDDEWWQALQGKQCMARVSHKEKTVKNDDGPGRTFTEAKILKRDDFFSVYADEVSEVPKDEDALVAGGYIIGETKPEATDDI